MCHMGLYLGGLIRGSLQWFQQAFLKNKFLPKSISSIYHQLPVIYDYKGLKHFINFWSQAIPKILKIVKSSEHSGQITSPGTNKIRKGQDLLLYEKLHQVSMLIHRKPSDQ